jgi:PhoPQ-activated pathogenicity-related protein
MYVGQTEDTFYQRMLLNFSMIRTRKHDNVAEHFYSENHSVSDFMVIGIEKRVWRGHL